MIGAVGVDPAVAEERPVAAGVFAEGGVAVDDQDFFAIGAGSGDDTAEGVGDEGAAPELDAAVARALRGRSG